MDQVALYNGKRAYFISPDYALSLSGKYRRLCESFVEVVDYEIHTWANAYSHHQISIYVTFNSEAAESLYLLMCDS